MKRVEIRLNLEAVAPLLDVIKTAADGLGATPATAAAVPATDAEFAALWREDLLRGQGGDVAVLLGLFSHDFFASGLIALDPDNCEPVLRACAAVRLHLRERHLTGLDDEHLEAGEIAFEALPEAQRRAFAAYVFLATLQEIIVQHLDPTVLE